MINKIRITRDECPVYGQIMKLTLPIIPQNLLCTDEFVKWPWVFRHYRSRKWLRNITRENGPEP